MSRKVSDLVGGVLDDDAGESRTPYQQLPPSQMNGSSAAPYAQPPVSTCHQHSLLPTGSLSTHKGRVLHVKWIQRFCLLLSFTKLWRVSRRSLAHAGQSRLLFKVLQAHLRHHDHPRTHHCCSLVYQHLPNNPLPRPRMHRQSDPHLEVGIRFLATRRQFFQSRANVLDVILVTLCLFLLGMVLHDAKSCKAGGDAQQQQRGEAVVDSVLLIIRNTLQLARIVNMLRKNQNQLNAHVASVDFTGLEDGGHHDPLLFDAEDEQLGFGVSISPAGNQHGGSNQSLLPR
ncbi:hypothetical protein BCR44DRAFT_1241715 [Catenaria anguillulae PL171]|uniref:Uncharacterized protein n=1 Tax=Catenaria anguillulae PL171 TaxID=765915 RepID=A0A1Y2HCL9_9FUNG|nr:hypothetical protein BCR44DRAFT_1241715 [Catenaria anguillulae PL171]